jgi:hypothetical protein
MVSAWFLVGAFSGLLAGLFLAPHLWKAIP